MKFKIGVQVHKSGTENDVILRMIANVNEGIAEITPINIIGYLNTRNAIYPSANSLSYLYCSPDFSISEDGGKTFTLTFTFKEVHELTNVPAANADDIKDINAFSQ